jgi:hypothetical protein
LNWIMREVHTHSRPPLTALQWQLLYY